MGDETRSYHSPLREKRAAETRARILDGATRLLAQGSAALTIPKVAKEAGVAVPTVYRYFPNKEALEDGVVAHVRQGAGVHRSVPGIGLEGFLERSRGAWLSLSDQPKAALAVLLAAVGRELMDPQDRGRLAGTREMLGAELEGVHPEDAERFVKVIAALHSTPGAVAFLRHGLGAEESVELMAWLSRTLRAGLREGPGDQA